jgi:hypothetical protein
MAEIQNTLKRIHFAERTLLGLTFVSLLVHYVFHFQGTMFMIVFCMLTALMYFPFGFYFIGKPSENYPNTISIILGFVYALGMIAILLSALNIDSYRYPLIFDFFILLAVVIYFIFKMRSEAYPQTYVNAQFIRSGFIVFCSLFILLA